MSNRVYNVKVILMGDDLEGKAISAVTILQLIINIQLV